GTRRLRLGRSPGARVAALARRLLRRRARRSDPRNAVRPGHLRRPPALRAHGPAPAAADARAGAPAGWSSGAARAARAAAVAAPWSRAAARVRAAAGEPMGDPPGVRGGRP